MSAGNSGKLLGLQHNIRKSTYHIYLLIGLSFIDFFCVSVLLSCMFDYARSMQTSRTVLGLFSSYYGALQLVSSYLVSHFVKHFGSRTCLIWACFVCSLGYLLLGLSHSVLTLFLLRTIPGLFKHTNNISRTFVSRECIRISSWQKALFEEDEDSKLKGADANFGDMLRARMLGYLSSASSVGFILGPVVGAMVYDRVGFWPVSVITASGFFLMGVCSMIGLEDVDNEEKSQRSTSKAKDSSTSPPKLVMLKDLWLEFSLQFSMALMMLIYRANYSVMIKEAYGSTTTQTSLLTSIGAGIASVSGLFVAPLFHYVGRDSCTRMLRYCAILQCAIFCAALWAPNLLWLAVSTAPLSGVNTIARENFQMLWHAKGITTSAQLSEVIGLSGSLIAFARLIGPFLGGLVHEYGHWGPPALATAVSAVSVIISFCL